MNFSLGPVTPSGGLVLAPDGNYYGTTTNGGAANTGTIFRMTPAGAVTTILEFTADGPGNNGANPNGPLVVGPDGALYGTTQGGGTLSYGTVFKVTMSGALTTLTSFRLTGVPLGANPGGPLAFGSDGNFYGTTVQGGSLGYGTVFRVTPAGALTTLVEFTFNGAMNKGYLPYAGLLEGPDGNFYGSTSLGGTLNLGTIFRMTPAGVLTTLVNFSSDGGTNRGAYPYAKLTLGADGNFYGVASSGALQGNGTAFRMTPAGVLTTLVQFTGTGGANKGSSPYGGLFLAPDGNFYGSTQGGGAILNSGTLFRMTPAGVLTTLVEFTRNGATNRGRTPSGDFVLGSDGTFYSTTMQGGAGDYGTVFKLASSGSLTTLTEFSIDGVNVNPLRGAYPFTNLVRGADGNFYGTTREGGAASFGSIYRVTPEGAVTTLVEFTKNGSSNPGSYPVAALILANDGNFYGTTFEGGTANQGTIFRMTPAGVLTTLVEFTGGDPIRGGNPYGALVQGSNGDLYGTTQIGGGSTSSGTVFRMTLAGDLTTIVNFSGTGATNRGALPCAALIEGTDGNLYGTTVSGGASNNGTVFRMTPAGALTTLAEFGGTSVSVPGPFAPLVQGADGNFYGTTRALGSFNFGTIFRVTLDGALTTLVNFTRDGTSNRGGNVFSPLALGPDGNFYGTTSAGGIFNSTNSNAGFGTVFRMTPAGVLTTLIELTENGPTNKGAYPYAGLTFSADGNFYGTTSKGGMGGGGTIFRLRVGFAPLFTSIVIEPNVGTRVRWQNAPTGTPYRVEFNADLLSPWQSFPGTVTASAGGLVEFVDSTMPSPTKRFYRLVTPP